MTSELPTCLLRLLVDEQHASGVRNMAVDECLLEAALNHDVATVRVYGWREATVSLGYFQPSNDPDRERRFPDLPTVRRLSGGGAILHHLEVTYSLALGPQHPLTREPSRLYRLAHDAILSVLNSCGVAARLRGVDQKESAEPFLCFSRGDKHDIVLGDDKIVGSAQRRRRGAVLQHGSLLLRRSPYADELPGLLDLAPQCPLPDGFDRQLGLALVGHLEAATAAPDAKRVVETSALTNAEQLRVQELMESTYSHLNWGTRR